jgi:hypothetical protein
MVPPISILKPPTSIPYAVSLIPDAICHAPYAVCRAPYTLSLSPSGFTPPTILNHLIHYPGRNQAESFIIDMVIHLADLYLRIESFS